MRKYKINKLFSHDNPTLKARQNILSQWGWNEHRHKDTTPQPTRFCSVFVLSRKRGRGRKTIIFVSWIYEPESVWQMQFSHFSVISPLSPHFYVPLSGIGNAPRVMQFSKRSEGHHSKSDKEPWISLLSSIYSLLLLLFYLRIRNTHAARSSIFQFTP